MKLLVWLMGIVLVAQTLTACDWFKSGGKDSAPRPAPGPGPNPGPGPGPAPTGSVLANLSDAQLLSIHSCLTKAWDEHSEYWQSVGSPHLLRCIREFVVVMPYQITAQLEVDFSNLFHALHDRNGQILKSISPADIRRGMEKGEGK